MPVELVFGLHSVICELERGGEDHPCFLEFPI